MQHFSLSSLHHTPTSAIHIPHLPLNSHLSPLLEPFTLVSHTFPTFHIIPPLLHILIASFWSISLLSCHLLRLLLVLCPHLCAVCSSSSIHSLPPVPHLSSNPFPISYLASSSLVLLSQVTSINLSCSCPFILSSFMYFLATPPIVTIL